MTPTWTADWAWSLPLTAFTLAIHVAAAIWFALLPPAKGVGRKTERKAIGPPK